VSAAPITTNMAHLTLKRLLPIEFPLPPREEQIVIIDRHCQMRDAIDDIASILEERDRVALRQSILKAAFEGRLVLQDSADEPASVLLARVREGSASADTSRGRRGRKRDRSASLELPLFTARDPGSVADAAG